MTVQVPQLSMSDQAILDQLITRWRAKLPRNLLRSTYYDAKQPLLDLGIAVPPQLRDIDHVLGWPAKGVNALARRCIFDAYKLPGYDGDDPLGISEFFTANNMESQIAQGIMSGMIHSTAFITTTNGNVDVGEPDILQNVRSAKWGAGLWDRRRHALSAALAVTNVDLETTNQSDELQEFVMYLPDRVLEFTNLGNGKWDVWEQDNPIGRVPVQVLPYQPELERPFGHSRITRAAMSLTDQAARSTLRTEISAEFFSAPQRYILGADEDAFNAGEIGGVKRAMWNAVIGRFLAIGRDPETDQMPQVGQFPQHSMEPHNAHFRTIAAAFAAEMNLAPATMGIITDANPASAESWAAAKEELIIEAEAANRDFGRALVQSAIDAIMLRDGLSEPTDEMRRLSAKFRNPATPSRAAASDAATKQVATFPWMAQSDVILEELGYDEDTLDRLRADRRRFAVASLAAALPGQVASASGTPEVIDAASQGAPGETDATGADEASVFKTKFDAIGVAVRAGVDPADAAERVGLAGLRFTGATPVALRPVGE